MCVNSYIINGPVRLGFVVVVNNSKVINNYTRKIHTRNRYIEGA